MKALAEQDWFTYEGRWESEEAHREHLDDIGLAVSAECYGDLYLTTAAGDVYSREVA